MSAEPEKTSVALVALAHPGLYGSWQVLTKRIEGGGVKVGDKRFFSDYFVSEVERLVHVREAEVGDRVVVEWEGAGGNAQSFWEARILEVLEPESGGEGGGGGTNEYNANLSAAIADDIMGTESVAAHDAESPRVRVRYLFDWPDEVVVCRRIYASPSPRTIELAEWRNVPRNPSWNAKNGATSAASAADKTSGSTKSKRAAAKKRQRLG